MTFHVGRPDGPQVGEVQVPATGQWENWRTVTAELRDPGGVHDLYVVAGPPGEGTSGRFNLDVLEFIPAAPGAVAGPDPTP